MPDDETASLDIFLDTFEEPPMSWQRRVIRQVLTADTPDAMFCHQIPRDQIRLGLDYHSLMEHYSIEVIRKDSE